MISGHLEKVTVKNYEEIAQKIVKDLDTRSTVQHLAALVVRQANKWYAPSFHEQLDAQKRNLCDNFVGSLVHALALRVKPIKDVPTSEGLSGIPLLKADLLSVWIYRRMSIGPIAAALYNSRNLNVDDLQVIIRACLETAYTAKAGNIGDALLLLELGGREVDAKAPAVFAKFLDDVKALLDVKRAKSSQRAKIGDRLVSSMYDRYEVLVLQYRQGWRTSPYGARSPDTEVDRSSPVQDDGVEAVKSTNDVGEETESLQSPSPPTPVSLDEPEHQQADLQSKAVNVDGDTVDLSQDTAGLTIDSVWTDGKTHAGFVPVSPWNAYFAEVMSESQQNGNNVGRRAKPDPLQLSSNEGERRKDAVVVAVDDGPDTDGAVAVERSRRTSIASVAGSSYAVRAQMEIMQRQFPAELMQRPGRLIDAETTTTTSNCRTVNPSHSEALGLHRGLQTGSVREGTRNVASPSTSPRRRVNSEAGHGAVSTIKMPSSSSSRSVVQYGPRRASEAQAVLSKSTTTAESARAFPATFHGDAIWIQLNRPEPYGVHIRFPSDFRIGDAQRIARHLYEALSDAILDAAAIDVYESVLHFTPSGAVVQDLDFGHQHIFVEFAPDMTLAQARTVGQTLHEAASQLAI